MANLMSVFFFAAARGEIEKYQHWLTLVND